MPDFPEGAVKQDPVSKAIAVKLPAGSPLGEWGYMSLDRGGGFLTSAQVAAWDSLRKA